MTAIERPESFTVTLTEQQRQTVLAGLANELLDAKRYLSGMKPSEQPGPMDECCDAHLERWKQNVEIHAALKAKTAGVEQTIEQFLYDGEVF